jgi:hypothetical protein
MQISMITFSPKNSQKADILTQKALDRMGLARFGTVHSCFKKLRVRSIDNEKKTKKRRSGT